MSLPLWCGRAARRTLLVALLAPSTASAQRINGRVLDRATRQPLRGLIVELYADTGSVTHTRTDSGGIFLLTAPKAGSYRLRFDVDAVEHFYTAGIQLDADSTIEKEFVLVTPVEHTYFEFEVQTPVQPMPGNRPPAYPEELRQQSVQGTVLTQFVVDTMGRPRMGTFKVLSTTDERFSEAVRLALPAMRFTPARIRGHRVPQLVQMPFEFSLRE